MQSKRTVVLVLTWLIVMALLGNFEIFAQQTINSQSGTETNSGNQKLPNFYGHLFGGAGFSFVSSDDITSLLIDDVGIGIGLPSWSYGIRCGFRHIAQFEYNFGKSHHNLNKNSIIKSIPSTVVKMDYHTKEMQFKVNPLFWKKTSVNSKGFTKAIFLVGGFGDVEWRDKADDGFEGTSSIYGIEYALLSKHKSVSFSFKRYGIEFDPTIIDKKSLPKTNASDYIFEIKFGLGTGI